VQRGQCCRWYYSPYMLEDKGLGLGGNGLGLESKGLGLEGKGLGLEGKG
jgi:hypothetical protein